MRLGPRGLVQHDHSQLDLVPHQVKVFVLGVIAFDLVRRDDDFSRDVFSLERLDNDLVAHALAKLLIRIALRLERLGQTGAVAIT